MALPGEPYHQLGVEISRDRGGPVLVLGYTNGYIGYIPTREAYAGLDYEILVSPLAPGGGERLRDAATSTPRQQYWRIHMSTATQTPVTTSAVEQFAAAVGEMLHRATSSRATPSMLPGRWCSARSS